MRVRRVDDNGDWVFGKSSADYMSDSDAISQNVKTRIKSFKNDWFLDVEAEIDWFALLGAKGTKKEIEREVERVVLDTDGVTRVDYIEIIVDSREATILLSYTNIYDKQINGRVTI